MYAIVETQGAQFKVSKDLTIDVPKMEAAPGEKVTLEKVLLIEDKGSTLVGTPYLKGARVEVSVLSHFKGDKIVVFKYKSKKNYRRKKGHRQEYSRLLVQKIVTPKRAISKS